MTYISRAIKRPRRSQAEMAAIRQAIFDVVFEERPMTVRQTFYRLVSAGVIDKTEAEYNGTIGRLLTVMRRSGEIPWGWITDFTRAMRKPRTFNDLEHAVQHTAAHYRRALWHGLDTRVEIWLEKDALAGVMLEETSTYDVPLMVTRGYPSLTFLHNAGQEIEAARKRTWIYYFGDHDPSGVDIPRKVEAGLREFAPTAEIHFERVAVLPGQIDYFNLPTRPTKRTDTRAKDFDGESVEVDAIAPNILRFMCRRCIKRHLTDDILKTHEVAEESERALLNRWAEIVNVEGHDAF